MWRYISAMSRDFRPHRSPADVLDYEIAQEQAAALGRMGRKLEEALAKLREFDAAHPRSGAPVPAHPLGAEAAEFGPYDDRRVRLAEWMLADDVPARLGLQIHKFIWDPALKGV